VSQQARFELGHEGTLVEGLRAREGGQRFAGPHLDRRPPLEIDQPPTRDHVQPPHRGRVARLEPAACDERRRERLSRQIGREIRRHPAAEVAVDRRVMAGVEEPEGLGLLAGQQFVVTRFGAHVHGSCGRPRV
jgi:hypothetical protein